MAEKTILVSSDTYESLLAEVKKGNELLSSIETLNHELVELNKQKISISHRIDNRQALENHKGKKWTAITVLIMVCAFYVEIVKIDDISILKNRAIDFIHSATDTYKVKVD